MHIVGIRPQRMVHLLNKKADTKNVFINNGFKIEGRIIYYPNGDYFGKFYNQNDFKTFVKEKGIDYKSCWGHNRKPDKKTKTLYIVEMKYQTQFGTVEEKLETCDYKKKSYNKAFNRLGIKVEYCYILSDWFLKNKSYYTPILSYIEDSGCSYFFNNIDLSFFGIDTKKKYKEESNEYSLW